MDQITLNGLSSADVTTFVVYDKKRGDIVHVHQMIVLPGAKPTDIDPAKAAIERACSCCGRESGSLAALKIESKQLEMGKKYKVDPRKQLLQVVRAGPARARAKAGKTPAKKTPRKRRA